MDYPCVKFGDFSFSRFGFIVRTDRQTHAERITHGITDVDDCYTDATIVGVSRNYDTHTKPETAVDGSAQINVYIYYSSLRMGLRASNMSMAHGSQ